MPQVVTGQVWGLEQLCTWHSDYAGGGPWPSQQACGALLAMLIGAYMLGRNHGPRRCEAAPKQPVDAPERWVRDAECQAPTRYRRDVNPRGGFFVFGGPAGRFCGVKQFNGSIETGVARRFGEVPTAGDGDADEAEDQSDSSDLFDEAVGAARRRS